VGDFNGDGKQDVVGTNFVTAGNDTITFLAGNGDGTFEAAVSIFYPGG